MRINTNMAALNAWRSLSVNSNNMTKSLEKLSSGYRVNRAADDAAGLAVSEKMRAQIRGLNMAIRNAQDGVSLIQTAEGGAQKIQDILQRMRELAVQASSGTLKPEDRALLNTEFQQLLQEIDRTANSTTFNQLSLINSAASDIKIQVGANKDVSATDGTGGTGGTTTYTITPTGLAAGIELVPDETQATGEATYTLKWNKTDSQIEIYDSDTTLVGVLKDTTDTFDQNGVQITASTFNFDADNNGLSDGEPLGTIEVKAQSTGGSGDPDDSAAASETNTITLTMSNLTTQALNISDLKLVTFDTDGKANSADNGDEARNAIAMIDEALNTVSTTRAEFGAYQNRLEAAIETLQIQAENLTAAESRIRDVDMALEMATFTKYQILQQASTAMLAQANMSTQAILSLLR